MTRLRLAVIGLGHLGNYHVQKLLADERVQLRFGIDVDERARKNAEHKFNISTVATLAECAEQLDAVIIAAPTSEHFLLAQQALECGLHVLVEKPLTTHAYEAEQLIALAKQKQRLLQTGHTERFNPAIMAAEKLFFPHDTPRYIVCERLGAFSGRSTDINVVLDLMIHDLDLIAHWLQSPLTEVRALGVPVLTSAIDMTSARLAFANGCVAQLSAGRVSLEASRKLRLFTQERYISIDCSSREVKVVRRLPKEEGEQWPHITGEYVEVIDHDALAIQDRAFVTSILNNEPAKVDGHAGLTALSLAHAVLQAI